MLEPKEQARYEREIKAMISRVSTDDPEGFAFVVNLIDQAGDQLRPAALGLNSEGYSWDAIGRALGVTASAAFQRFKLPKKGRRRV